MDGAKGRPVLMVAFKHTTNDAWTVLRQGGEQLVVCFQQVQPRMA